MSRLARNIPRPPFVCSDRIKTNSSSTRADQRVPLCSLTWTDAVVSRLWKRVIVCLATHVADHIHPHAHTQTYIYLSNTLLVHNECVLSRFNCVRLFATPWTVACQALLSMELSRQECWSGLHAVLQGIFPTQGSNPHLLHLLHWQVGSLPLAPPGKASTQ